MSETVLEPLVHLLVISDLEVQKAASHALSNLALHGAGKWFVKWCEFHFYIFGYLDLNKETIISAGALRPLIVLLGVANSDVQCNACGCITTLATLGGCVEWVWYGCDHYSCHLVWVWLTYMHCMWWFNLEKN